jgi:hypothetical protein
MPSYVESLLAQRGGSRSDAQIAWELREALEEKTARGETLSDAERTAARLCSVNDCDGIEEILDTDPDAVKLAAEFAVARGLAETARILTNASNGIPVPGPVSVSVVVNGKTVERQVPVGRWGATDITLSLCGENLDGAILEFAAEQITAFAINPPAKVARRGALDARVAELAAHKSAADLLREVVTHRNPRVRAQIREDEIKGDPSDWREVRVKHQANGPASANSFAKLRKQYGAAADALLDAYAVHDGAALFVVDEEPGFVFLPVADWSEHRDDVMSWAREVTWQDEPEEIPGWLESVIPFGYTPGDSKRWLLATSGPHTGKVLRSPSGEPRYASIGEFFAALILDAEHVLGIGGYVSYAAYYPREYLFDT